MMTDTQEFTSDDSAKVLRILEELEIAEGRLAREEILEQNSSCELLRLVLTAACDKSLNFYVAKVAKSRPSGKADSDLHRFVCEILPKLSSRTITGGAAQRLVSDFFVAASELDQKWCKRILLKNLRVGVQESTISKVWPGLIKTFEVQLADTLDVIQEEDGSYKLNEQISYPIRVEPKIDGFRLIAIKRNGLVELFTRNGKPVDTLPTIQSAIAQTKMDDIVLDGEIYSQTFNDTSSLVLSSKSRKDDSFAEYHIFDMMSLLDWETKESSLSLADRTSLVENFVSSAANANLKQVPGIIASSFDDILSFYKKCLEDSFEGVMLKNLRAPYVFDRTHHIKKFKPIRTHEGVIAGWFSGRLGSKREDLFNGFWVELKNGVKTKVGSGLNDKIRMIVQAEGPDSYLGKIIECECAVDPFTPDGLSEDGKMRFPVFIRFRDVADVDKSLYPIVKKYKKEVPK